ncbi:LysR family transcriptional regulator [Variovorax sp. KK3]|uniref:LysR family transcriptional regulator n=1 Tax=Variovorax sp. KK3 TaxID=1855728 RepID=UPI002740EC0D|nr:LysR family transcriptional regulator [Variovorax sp. KK3]
MNAFVLVATRRSFRRAADELGMAPSSLSHAMRSLESNLGVRLLNRTTRSVALTEAGDRLLARLSPMLEDVEAALAEASATRDVPAGTVRINAPETAALMLTRHVIPCVLDRFPEVNVDLVTEGRFVDIVEAGFDAGVRLGETVPQDMVAVRFGEGMQFLTVASPTYLKRVRRPKAPEDLLSQACIRHRMPSGKLYRWEFERSGEKTALDVPGRLTFNSIALMVEAALEHRGIAYVPKAAVAPFLQSGRLVPVLEDWCPPGPGLFLYYPGHRQIPSALQAFIQVLRARLP